MTAPSALFLEMTKDLPRRPIEAISVVADRIKRQIIDPQRLSLPQEEYMTLTTFLDRFSSKFGLNIAFPVPSASASNYQRLSAYVSTIRGLGINAVEQTTSDSIDDLILQYEGVTDTSFGIARLNEEEKKKILHHLEKARVIVEQSNLPDRKKNALFERLANLIREVSTIGTRTDRFFAFAGDLGFVLGDMAEKAKPLFIEVKEILKIVTRSRARQEGISLPTGDEVLRIPPPSETKED